MAQSIMAYANKLKKEAEIKRPEGKEWYSPRSLLGNDWAIFYIMLGGREAGKSYSVTEFFVRQWRKYKRPFYWLRLTEKSAQKLLTNNAEKLIDADIKRKYNIETVTKGDSVYEVKYQEREIKHKDGTISIKKEVVSKELMARVLALSTFYNDKGSALFDKDFLNDPNMYYNIALDEFQPEKNERRTFDVVYAFTNQLENLVRSTKTRVRVICIGNTLEEAADILCSFNFIPNDFGRYYLKKKRCVIEYIEPSEAYIKRRRGTIADILMPTASTFTNKVETDTSLIYEGKLVAPHTIIKFSMDQSTWFTIWNHNVIAPYNKEKCKNIIAMRPYLNDVFIPEKRDNVIMIFDTRSFLFKNLITFKKFKKELELLKPRKGA